MTIFLDKAQQTNVDARRKADGQRPQYYNASDQASREISTDFEAFLILQGQQGNSQTIQWLDQASNLTVVDIDRDALAAQFIQNDINDASNAMLEISALVDSFNQFRKGFDVTGFESVPECGLLLADLQRPMQEAQTLSNRLQHRITYGTVFLDFLSNSGVTTQDEDQINSWYSPLSAY